MVTVRCHAHLYVITFTYVGFPRNKKKQKKTTPAPLENVTRILLGLIQSLLKACKFSDYEIKDFYVAFGCLI
jgi:hypothetical protein